jgi:ribonuclease R
MLPRYLTTEVCSLQPASDRLTRSVFVDIDPDGYGVLNRETCASVIHSRARLTYEQVQQLFDAGDEPSIDAEVKAALLEMRGLARALRQQRVQQGSIDFAMPEIKCELNAEGRVVALRRREAREAYQLIEEFMLVANQAVARIIDGRERPGLYRVHDEPDEEQWAKMSADLLALGISVLPTSRADINRITRQVDGSPIAYATQLAILKNFKRAEYVAERRSHFGLAFDYYTHFTSPIRRYPDLVTHRILGALEAGLPSPYGAAELEAVARHCSMMEREADAAEKESVDIKRVEFFQRRLWDGDVGPFKGLVTAVTPKGLIVELGESLQRGMVPFSSFVDDYYRVNPDRTQAAGRRSRRTWSVGQPVRVELTRVDTTRRLVDFRMVDQPSVRKGKGRRRNR